MFSIPQEQVSSVYLGIFQVDKSGNKNKNEKKEYADEFCMYAVKHT